MNCIAPHLYNSLLALSVYMHYPRVAVETKIFYKSYSSNLYSGKIIVSAVFNQLTGV
jgi:hypothetical protein